MNKEKILNVVNWVAGILLASLGVAFCTKANFGLSMIGASPYIIHVWLRDTFTWFSQGTAEYVWESVLLIITCIIVRQFKWRYLLSFGTAVISGFVIDGWLYVVGGNGAYSTLLGRSLSLVAGMVVCSLGVAFFFHSTMPLQVYELLVAEVSKKYNKDLNKVKLINDITLLVVAIALSVLLTKGLTGLGIGTIIITVCNAPLIKYLRIFIDKLEKVEQ